MSDPTNPTTIVWFGRDLRISDNTALSAGIARGGPVVPVFIRDKNVDALGAAAKWRLEQAIECFAKTLETLGSRLILRAGDPAVVLAALAQEIGTGTAIYWSKAYDPARQSQQANVARVLSTLGVTTKGFSGHLLFDPASVTTKTGGFYRVYTPLWNAVRDIEIAPSIPAPTHLLSPNAWPISDTLNEWNMGRAMNRGARVMAAYCDVGEHAAQRKLADFTDERIAAYSKNRDIPSLAATSGMSVHLAVGEISPRQCWNAAMRAQDEGKQGAEKFRKEIVWREFAYHLLHHTPHIVNENWRPEWDRFPWSEDADHPHVLAWKQGRTGVAFVDAAMREMYVTGIMHNRGRMIVASYLTKHMMVHWKIGKKWFDDCLIDWDPAANALGWQWTAGSGPDAAPYFRVFNPQTQLEKFDPDGVYARAWIAEGQVAPPRSALDYFAAIPRSWTLDPGMSYPQAPIVSLSEGRERALSAYKSRDF